MWEWFGYGMCGVWWNWKHMFIYQYIIQSSVPFRYISSTFPFHSIQYTARDGNFIDFSTTQPKFKELYIKMDKAIMLFHYHFIHHSLLLILWILNCEHTRRFEWFRPNHPPHFLRPPFYHNFFFIVFFHRFQVFIVFIEQHFSS